jgi:hypothetical protein
MKNLVRIHPPDDPRPAYVPPRVETYTSEELLKLIGPAMACSPSPSPEEEEMDQLSRLGLLP